MDNWVWIVLAVIVLVLVFLVFVGRRAMGGVDPTKLTFDPGQMAKARQLAVANKKAEAIRVLRESAPGLGLVDAKRIVDRMAVRQSTGRAGDTGALGTGPGLPSEPSEELPSQPGKGFPSQPGKGFPIPPGKRFPIPPPSGMPGDPMLEQFPSASPVPLDIELLARSLKAERQTDEAVRTVREATGMSPAEAKQYVDSL